jgi:hypothetical protein
LLAEVQSSPQLADWTAAIHRELIHLERQPLDASKATQDTLRRLRQLSTPPSMTDAAAYQTRQRAARLSYAIRRRTDTWIPVSQLATEQFSGTPYRDAAAALSTEIANLKATLAAGDHGAAWGDFFRIDDLTTCIAVQDDAGVDALAEAVLHRMYNPALSPGQRTYLSTPRIVAFVSALRTTMAARVTPTDLVSHLEAYELEPNRNHSNEVVRILRRWQSTPDPSVYQPTVQAIKTHYRNANLRVAVRGDLINRVVPAISRYAEQVNDTILGAQVHGQNSTSTAISISLIPDPQRIRLKLNARGQVQSNTTARKGPVTMFNRGESTFTAGKQLTIAPDGIFLSKTTATANTGNRLLGLRSDLDQVPLIGWLVRSIALQQHDDQRPQVRTEVISRVRRSASQKIDREVQQRLAAAEKRVEQNLVDPLRSMDLDPRTLEMRTTAERVIMRARIASPLQFGANTPRPQSRADSLLSVQIHHTAANNLIEQLNLHGRRMTLAELMDSVSEAFGLDLHVNDERNNETIIQFADEHPLEFEFKDGKITLTIHFAELDNGRHQWKNFSARAYYRADVDQLDVELVRDQGIELISDRLRLRDQLLLRGIFTKVFARNHRLDMLRQAIQQQPKLKNLVVTQFTIRDGWMGIALGDQVDQRLAKRPSRPAVVEHSRGE